MSSPVRDWKGEASHLPLITGQTRQLSPLLLALGLTLLSSGVGAWDGSCVCELP